MNAEQLYTGIEHVALAARDPRALAEWYARTLGFHAWVAFDNGSHKPPAFLIGPTVSGPWVEIIPAAPHAGASGRERENTDPGWTHLAVQVSDFDAALRDLDTKGVRKDGGERTAPFGARVQFYRDPEGNLFHLLFRPDPLPLAPRPAAGGSS